MQQVSGRTEIKIRPLNTGSGGILPSTLPPATCSHVPVGPPGSASKDSSYVSSLPGVLILLLLVTLSLSVQVSILRAKVPKPFQALHGQTLGRLLYIYWSLNP